MPRIIGKDPQQIAVVGPRRIDGIVLELLLVVLAERSVKLTQRIDFRSPRQHRLLVGEFRHQLVHVLQLLKRRPAHVALAPIRTRREPDRERLGEIFVRVALRVPEPEMLNEIPTRRIRFIVAWIACR